MEEHSIELEVTLITFDDIRVDSMMRVTTYPCKSN